MNICKTCKTIKRNMKIDIKVGTDHKPLTHKTSGSLLKKYPVQINRILHQRNLIEI